VTQALQRAGPHVALGALCVGLALANLVRVRPMLAAVMVLIAAAAVIGLQGPARAVSVAVLLLVLGLGWGSLRLTIMDRSILGRYVGHAGRVLVEVTGPSRRGEYALRMPGRALRFNGRRVGEPVFLKLPLGRSPPQGARLELTAQVEAPRGPKDGFDERAWLRRQGIHVVLSARDFRIVGHRGGIGGLADRLRRWLGRGAAAGVDGERRAVILGVVLGADEGLSKSLRNRFRSSGLYHLLAVSGQNVAIIAAGLLLLAWLAGMPRWLGEVAVLGAIAGYVLAVGLQPSVVRAGVAGGVASLAWLAARPRDRWYFLLLGGAVLLAWNPYNVFDPGFQLSFAAVAAIFVAVPRLQRWFEGYPVPRFLAAIVAVSTVCGLVTAPILWLDFGTVPVFSVLGNALAEPAVAPLLGLGLIAATVNPLAPGVAASIGWLNGWVAAYLAWCARLIGGLPHAQVASLRVLLGLASSAAALWALLRLRA
jgi:competence protein ComEC